MKFKKYIQIPFIRISSLIFLMNFIATACEVPAGEVDWGFSLLYMPQAVVQSAGNDNNYFVEIDSSMNNDTLIVVGLYRSGLEELHSVSVDLNVYEDTLNYLIAEAQKPDAGTEIQMFRNARLLNPEYYSIPSTLSLDDGERTDYDYITVHKNNLWSDTAANETIFVLPLRISNPTRYELNYKLSTTLFIFSRNK